MNSRIQPIRAEDTTPLLAGFAQPAMWRSLARRRPLLLACGLGGAVLAAVAALLIPNEYRSSAELMPPEQSALTTVSALTPMTGQLPVMSGGGLLNAKTPGATSIGILQSRTVQDDLINRFDLRRVYYRKTYASTRTRLAKNTHIEENRKNGIIDIDVTDSDPYRARDLGRAYIQDLNKLLNRLSTSTARREREFLEGRLASVKQALEADTQALSRFSSRNATLDYQKQGQATLEVAGKLEEELAAAETELSSLKAVYTGDNVQVSTLNARIGQLRAQLNKITGQNDKSEAATLAPGAMFPSIRQLPLLGATYAELMRRVTSDEVLYATLEKQYELARVQEAKEIPAVKVLDEPDVPEKKIFPPRPLFVLGGLVLGVLAAAGWVLLQTLRQEPHRFGLGSAGEPALYPAPPEPAAAAAAANL